MVERERPLLHGHQAGVAHERLGHRRNPCDPPAVAATSTTPRAPTTAPPRLDGPRVDGIEQPHAGTLRGEPGAKIGKAKGT